MVKNQKDWFLVNYDLKIVYIDHILKDRQMKKNKILKNNSNNINV